MKRKILREILKEVVKNKRMGGVEPLSQAWEAWVIAVIQHPQQ